MAGRAPRAAAAILLAAVLGTACSQTGEAPVGDPDPAAVRAGDLAGRTFIATTIVEASGVDRPVVPGTRLRLTFDGDRLDAASGCNTFSADVAVEDGRLAVGDLVGGRMACQGALAAQEDALVALLASDPQITAAAHEIELVGAGRATFTEAETGGATAADLAQGPWRIDAVLSQGDRRAIPAYTSTSATFTETAFELAAGCFAATGSHRFAGTVLVVEGWQRSGCSEDPELVAVDPTAALETGQLTVTRVDADVLILRSDDGRGLELRRRDPAP